MAIMIKTPAEIEKMRRSGLVLRQVHDAIAPLVAQRRAGKARTRRPTPKEPEMSQLDRRSFVASAAAVAPPVRWAAAVLFSSASR